MGVVLETRKLTKRFPGTIASNEIDFDVRSGEVHAIIGENGAGKSTICKMLTGLYQPDSGEIYFMGRKVVFRSTGDAMRAGINMVYQERNLIAHLTGAQNIMLGSEPVRGRFFLDEKRLREMAKGIQDRLGLEIPLDVPVGTLSAGVQQSIEILRAFATEPRLLVLDEPTASLGEREIVPFLHFVEELRSRMEIAVIFISHKLDEVFQVADRISVFTEGVKVMTVNKPETTREACIAAMLKNGSPEPIVVRQTVEKPATVLRAGTCVYDGRPHRLDIHVEEGEVVGFYGLVGAGRTECAQAIAGLRPMQRGEVEFCGEPVRKFTTHEMIARGLVMTPELRAHGMFQDDSLIDNIGVLFLRRFVNWLGLVDAKARDAFALDVLGRNNVRYASPRQRITSLSGGNIQKIIIGRSVALENIRLLILDEPTNGLDLGAKHEVYLKARHIAEEGGKAVIFISSEMDEVLSVCNRIYVFAFGHVVQEFKREEFSRRKLLEAAFRRGSYEQ